MTEVVALGDRLVGDGQPPYIVAEACINHGGDIAVARKMTYLAHAMGCNAIKFQMHVLDDEMLRETPQSANFSDSLYDTLDETNLKVSEHLEIKQLCDELGITYLCTPFSKASADLVDEIGVVAFKTGSGELTNLPLLRHIASKGRPMIISTGMSLLEEVSEAVETVKAAGVPIILTHCVSAYPCPYNRVNLGNIQKYRDLFDVPVGLSDHSIGIYTSLGAVALGACFIEKHFSLDRTLPGPDHKSSIEPYEFGELVKGARAVFEASGTERAIFPEEQEIVAWARESVVSIRPIAKGNTITEDMVSVKRPSPGDGVVPAKCLDAVIGRTAKVDIAVDSQIRWVDLSK